MEDLLANVQKQEQHKKDNLKNWDINTVSKLWQEYMNTLDTHSTVVALGSAKLTIEGDNKIKIVTPNKLNTETIKKEMNLIEKIRDAYPDRELIFSMVDDISQFPELDKVEKVKKSKTNEEKLELLVDKNPKVSEFIERFNLKVDK